MARKLRMVDTLLHGVVQITTLVKRLFNSPFQNHASDNDNDSPAFPVTGALRSCTSSRDIRLAPAGIAVVAAVSCIAAAAA